MRVTARADHWLSAPSLGNHRVFELGERGEHAELQPFKRTTARRECAVDERHADAELHEEIEQVDEGVELSREAIDPVHHHLVDFAVLGGEHEFDEAVSAEGRAALTLVVEALHEVPAGLASWFDEGTAPEGLQLTRGDGWVAAGARNRLPSVDGASDDARSWS
jgi:hypothetical protein